MRRTRFRKRRQLWLPVFGTGGDTVEGITAGLAIGGQFLLANDPTANPGSIDWLASPLTFDRQIDPENAQADIPLGVFPPTLRDMVAGSEYGLRRVVGKCFVSVAEGAGTNATRAPAIEVGCGLIVCNTDEHGSPLTDFNQVNPLAQESAEDPWIWERHWLLGTFTNTSGFVNPNGTYDQWQGGGDLPKNNVFYGSMADGPHVDQKTSRRIRRDQRLFFVMATRPNELNDADPTLNDSITVYCRYMFRLLGNISSVRGNRGNAAR